MNKVTMKSRATVIGKAFAEKGVILTRAEQLELVAKLQGARGWNHVNSELKSCSGPAENKPLDALQLEVAQAYCAGDFSHVTDTAGVRTQGDMLFHFVMDEVGDTQGNREDSVRLLRQASIELEDLADALESNERVQSKAVDTPAPAPQSLQERSPLKVVTASGTTVDWDLFFLTNRFGEADLSAVHSDRPELADWDKREPQAYEKLWSVCLDECAFIAELNGVRGVLYEVEIETTESEGCNGEGKPYCTVSEADRRVQLLQQIGELEKEHPQFSWVVADPVEILEGRLGVWGFCPESRLITKDEAHALIDTIFQKFYG